MIEAVGESRLEELVTRLVRYVDKHLASSLIIFTSVIIFRIFLKSLITQMV